VPVDETPERETGSTTVGSVPPPGGANRAADHDRLIAALIDPDFPIGLRGYDRVAVDDYLARVRAVLADLETSRSPDAAVRQALDAVGEETKAILQRAQQSADHLTARQREKADAMVAEAERLVADARTEAERILAAARADAERIRGEANAQISTLDADVDAIWQERARLLEDTRGLASALVAMADEADARFPAETDAASPSALQLVDQPTVEAAPPFADEEELPGDEATAETEAEARTAEPPDSEGPGPATPAAQANAEHEAAAAEDERKTP
jgi:cell division septum initiation protein DivIVA